MATIDMSRKLGGCAPFWGEAGSPSKKIVSWADAYLRTKWHLDPSSRLVTADIGHKMEGLCPFGEGAAASPSNTMWPGPRPTFLSSFILISLAFWPQSTPTSQTDGTDNGPIAKGEPFYKRSPKNSRCHKNLQTFLR